MARLEPRITFRLSHAMHSEVKQRGTDLSAVARACMLLGMWQVGCDMRLYERDALQVLPYCDSAIREALQRMIMSPAKPVVAAPAAARSEYIVPIVVERVSSIVQQTLSSADPIDDDDDDEDDLLIGGKQV